MSIFSIAQEGVFGRSFVNSIEKILKPKEEISPELKKKYWDGWFNKGVRHYFYITKGVEIFNFFRYVIMTIGMIYLFFKLNNPWYFPLMFMICMPPLDVVGWFSVHKMDKVTEFLQTRYATHYSHYQVELNEDQKNYLKSIDEKLDKLIDLLTKGQPNK